MFFVKVKQFFKNPVMVLVTLIFFRWIGKGLEPLLRYGEGVSFSGSIPDPLFLIPISFVLFMFLSYSFFAKDKLARTEEMIAALPGGRFRNYLAGFLVLGGVDLILLAGLTAYHIYCCKMSLGYLDFGAVLFGFKCYTVHIFFVNIFSILVGLAASFCRTDMRAYTLMMVVNCFFSQFFLTTLYEIAGNNETAYQAADLFGLTTRMYYARPDEDYIISIESIEWQRILFWIFPVLTIIVFHTVRRRKKLVTACLAAVSALFLCLYMQPSGASHVDVDSQQDAWSEEYDYYYEHPEYAGTYDNYLPAEDFHITKYEAELSTGRVLSARVKVCVDTADLATYTFALRHEYRVAEVRDEYGERVPFTQEGDQVVLCPDSGKEHSCFVFRYRGASKVHYSTSQAVRLPAYFAYLPFSGERYLYFNWEEASGFDDLPEDIREGMGSLAGEGVVEQHYNGSALEGLGYETDYDIKVESGHTVYCNLPEVGRNHFRGRSDGVTLAANAFLQKKEIAGANLVYTIAGNQYAPTDKRSTVMQDWETFIRENSLQGKTLFYDGVAFGGDEEYLYFGKDHLVLRRPYTEGYQWFLRTGEMPYNQTLVMSEWFE